MCHNFLASLFYLATLELRSSLCAVQREAQCSETSSQEGSKTTRSDETGSGQDADREDAFDDAREDEFERLRYCCERTEPKWPPEKGGRVSASFPFNIRFDSVSSPPSSDCCWCGPCCFPAPPTPSWTANRTTWRRRKPRRGRNPEVGERKR